MRDGCPFDLVEGQAYRVRYRVFGRATPRAGLVRDRVMTYRGRVGALPLLSFDFVLSDPGEEDMVLPKQIREEHIEEVACA